MESTGGSVKSNCAARLETCSQTSASEIVRARASDSRHAISEMR